MAKKTVDFTKLSLPERPALLKKDDDPVLVEKAVERIHRRKSISAQPASVAKTARDAQKTKVAATRSKVKIGTPTRRNSTVAADTHDENDAMVKKISMDLPVNVYTYLKLRSFRQAITMKEFVLGLIREEMRRVPA